VLFALGPRSCVVCIKFFARPRVPAISPSPSPMAPDDVGIVSVEHKEYLTERLDATLVDEEPMASMEVTSEQDAGSNESDASDDNGNASDNAGRVKIGAEAALAGMSFDFWISKALLSYALKDFFDHLG
jgi:hypothetical protein